jgi:E3 Ubiquitin ligase
MPTVELVGFGLLAVAVAAVVVWIMQNGKAGKIKSVPFRKPSEIATQGASAGDANQMISTEGQVAGQPLAAPMSGMACLYYELHVTRGYHTKSKNAQGQTTKNHGTKTILERKEGTLFTLTDGQGSVGIDCTKAPAMGLKQAHRNRISQGIVPRAVQFGSVVVEVEGLASNMAGALLGGETTDYYEGVEMIVPFVQGQKLYALGKLAPQAGGLAIGPTGWSALMLSDKGREGALGAAAKNAKMALIAGAVCLVGGGVCTAVGVSMGEGGGSHEHEKSASAPAAAKPPPAAPAKKK